MTWAVLVDRPVHRPATSQDGLRLIHKPPITCRMPAGLGCVDQQRSEPLYPPVDGHVINGDLEPTARAWALPRPDAC
jgi:hypothetical protein